MQTMKVARDTSETLEQVRDQFEFLVGSASRFDVGKEAESKRMATYLRVLLYRSRTSHPLLEQCSVLDKLWVFDSAGSLDGEKPGSVFSLVGVRMDVGETGGLDRAQYIPKFDEPRNEQPNVAYQVRELIVGRKAPRAPGFHLRAEEWWQQPVIRDSLGNEFSRRVLVESVANADGGAHVDPSLKPDYYALSRLNSAAVYAKGDQSAFSLTVGGLVDDSQTFTQLGSPVPASIRQIAWELIRSMKDQFPHLLPTPGDM